MKRHASCIDAEEMLERQAEYSCCKYVLLRCVDKKLSSRVATVFDKCAELFGQMDAKMPCTGRVARCAEQTWCANVCRKIAQTCVLPGFATYSAAFGFVGSLRRMHFVSKYSWRGTLDLMALRQISFASLLDRFRVFKQSVGWHGARKSEREAHGAVAFG